MVDKACRCWLTKRKGVAPFCRRTPATLAIHKILQSHHAHQLVQLLVKGLHPFVQGEAIIAAGSLRCRQWIDHLHDVITECDLSVWELELPPSLIPWLDMSCLNCVRLLYFVFGLHQRL